MKTKQIAQTIRELIEQHGSSQAAIDYLFDQAQECKVKDTKKLNYYRNLVFAIRAMEIRKNKTA